MGHGVLRVAAAAGLVAFVIGAAAPAHADDPEKISTYDTKMDVRADGSMKVTETIAYDFGTNRKHGIFRYIPAVFTYDDRHDRTYPIDDVVVHRDNDPEQFDVSTSGRNVEIKIGNPDDDSVTGAHTYVIAYTVRGAVNAFSDHEELYWNAVGAGWTVPIAAATAEVTGPAPIQKVACYAGPAGSTTPCATATDKGTESTFAQAGLGDGRDLTTVVSFPAGSIANPGPILTGRHDLAAAFQVTPVTVGGGGALAVLGSLAALVAAWRFGRDRRYVGLLPGLTPGFGENAEERRKPLRKPLDVVEFGPPDKIRPGQVGTLIDEKADVVDVTATIVDFAVRRHLQIREIGKRKDWELIRKVPLPRGSLPYERTLYQALFNNRDEVTLSTLKQTFAGDLAKVRGQLYADMVSQGWYKQSPKRTRRTARLVAAVILVATLGVTAGLAYFLRLGLVGAGLVVAAVVLLAVAGTFPARTGKGSAALARLRGFRLYIATAEAEQIKFQERVQIFSEFLPYAIVFGLADRWAGIFAKIGAFDADAGLQGTSGLGPLYWYSGPLGWNLGSFNASMHGFTSAAASAVTATPPSASGSSGFDGGGFSGGGGGGGGGGSW